MDLFDERADVAVGDGVDHAFNVAQHDRAQVDLFDRAADAVDVGRIAEADLILGDQEDPRDDVLDQRLRAEADRQADDAGAGQHRRDVDVELAQHHQDGRAPDQDREEPP